MSDLESGIGTGIGLGIGLGVAGMVMRELKEDRRPRTKKVLRKKKVFK